MTFYITGTIDTEKLLFEHLLFSGFENIFILASVSKQHHKIAIGITEYQQLLEVIQKYPKNIYPYALIEWALQNKNIPIFDFVKRFPPKKVTEKELMQNGLKSQIFIALWGGSSGISTNMHKCILYPHSSCLDDINKTFIRLNVQDIWIARHCLHSLYNSPNHKPRDMSYWEYLLLMVSCYYKMGIKFDYSELKNLNIPKYGIKLLHQVAKDTNNNEYIMELLSNM